MIAISNQLIPWIYLDGFIKSRMDDYDTVGATVSIVGLTILVLAALVSVVNLALLAPVWNQKSWPIGRRIRHTLVAILAISLVWYSHVMNVLGYQYF